MPVIDTEVLFAFSPKDSKHEHALRLLKEHEDFTVTDTSMLEFQSVLRARGRSPSQVKMALLALHEALARHAVTEVKTIDANLLALQCELEIRFNLSYFDSLIAASTLALDHRVVSDDGAFSKVPGIERIPLTK